MSILLNWIIVHDSLFVRFLTWVLEHFKSSSSFLFFLLASRYTRRGEITSVSDLYEI